MADTDNSKSNQSTTPNEIKTASQPQSSFPSEVGREHDEVEAQHKGYPSKPSSEAGRLTDWIIAIFTVVIAGAAILQWREMVNGGDYARRQTEAAEKIRLAADRQAGAADKFSDSVSHLETIIGTAQGNMQTMANSAQRSQTTVQTQFRLDQRPIIWVASIKDTEGRSTLDAAQINYGLGNEIAVGLAYENFGKSSAEVIGQKHGLGTGPNALAKIQMIESGIPQEFLPNGVVDFTTLRSGVLPDATIADAFNRDGGIAVRIQFRYKDSLGSLYESNLCWIRLKTTAWAVCEPSGTKDCATEHCDQ